MVAQVRGVTFRHDEADGTLTPETIVRWKADDAMDDVMEHLGFAKDSHPVVSPYLAALKALKRNIFDRATRTKWIKEHTDG